MSVKGKIEALLGIKGVKKADLAGCLGTSVQTVRNKFSLNRFSTEDLIKIANYLDCDLKFVIDDKQSVYLDISDIEDK